MSEVVPFLVQAEFFFGKFGGSLRSFQQDIAERMVSGHPLKRSVRFHDVEGRLTDRIVRWGRRRKVDTAITLRLEHVRPKRKKQLERAQKRIHAFDEWCEMIVPQLLDHLRGCVLRREEIALEEFGGEGFRLVAPNEAHELFSLLERAERPPWLFVFEHADLLAGRLKSVGSVM
jgi:hypothetical protein